MLISFIKAAAIAIPAIFGFRLVMVSTAHLRKKWRFTAFPDTEPEGFPLYFNLLSSKFSYFRLLDDKEQKLFVSRLRYIRDEKHFVGRGLELTEEMEVIVSAAIAQLTFGLSEFDLEDFSEIHLTPGTFYSRIVGQDVKGLTFDSGRIILSWKDFEEGYAIANDKINLGLHELAHAFFLDYFAVGEIENEFHEWNTAALREIQSMRMGTDSHFLRDYAATNIQEFWACSVECFFEAPVEFKKNIPDLYIKMCLVLKQDMAERMINQPLFQNSPLSVSNSQLS
jgi:Mlc titration factor MtfA (ptsG expression regulator)